MLNHPTRPKLWCFLLHSWHWTKYSNGIYAHYSCNKCGGSWIRPNVRKTN